MIGMLYIQGSDGYHLFPIVILIIIELTSVGSLTIRR